MLVAQVLSSHQIIAKFRVAGDVIEIVERDEVAAQAIATQLIGLDLTDQNKEEFLRHKAASVPNAATLQEGNSLQVLSDELPHVSPNH